MKIKKIFIVLVTVILLSFLVSCKRNIKHDISEYILEMEYEDDFKILQLSDIHLANKDDREKQYKFLKETINMAIDGLDLIVITGDSFTFGDKVVAKEFCKFFDSFEVPWTLTFGNHDEQCYFSIDWFTGYLNDLYESDKSYCIFKDIQDDNVYGNANFAINLVKDGTVKRQIILMDSNRYNYGTYIGYDYIKNNQIDWYKNIVDYTTELNGGTVVDSYLFFHIPLPEYNDAWNLYESGNTTEIEYVMGEKREKTTSPKENSGFFDAILEKGSSKLISVGHDHLNNFIIKYKGVYLSYGITSTDRVYYDDDLLGGTVFTLKSDNSIEFNQIIRSLDEYGD